MRHLSEFYSSTPSLKEKFGALIADYGFPSKVYLLEGIVKNTDHEGSPLINTNAFAFFYDSFEDERTTLYTHRITIKKVWGNPSYPNQPITEIPFTTEHQEYLYRDSIGGSPGMMGEWAGHIQKNGQQLDFSSGPAQASVVFTIQKCPKTYLIPLITFEDRIEDEEAKLLKLELNNDGSFSLKLKSPIDQKDILSRWLSDLGIDYSIS